MNDGEWEIGFDCGSLDALLSGESSAMTLWFLAGYLKGLSDGGELQNGVRRLVLEPAEDGSWHLRSRVISHLDAVREVGPVNVNDPQVP